MRVLTVQDNPSLAGGSVLDTAGSLIDNVSTDIANAPAILHKQDFHAIVIDVGRDMPTSDLVLQLRLAGIKTPILLIAPLDCLIEVVRSLSAGADDYMTLPLDTEAFVKRIFSLSREHSARMRPVLTLGKLRIDVARRILHVNGDRVHLTGKEFQMLELLATRQGQMITRGMILKHLYGGAYEPTMKIVDVFICKLRKKIQIACGVNYIETIWGRGFVLRDPGGEVVYRAMSA